MPSNHELHLYQKPALGNAFIKRFFIYNYKHSINAIGGFDTASCDIAVRSRDEGQQFLDQYLGNRVAFYVNNPVEPIWEGYINRMSFNAGGVQYSIGLDEMANHIIAHYVNSLLATTSPQITTAVDDTNSQAVYGIKGTDIDAGFQLQTTYAPNLASTVLAQRAWPKTSIAQEQGSGLLHIEFLGFFHTLEWELFNDTSTVAISAQNEITTILLPTVDNGTTFFDNTVTSGVDSPGYNINRNKVRGQSMWDIIRELVEAGNATDYFVAGITPTNFQTGTRTFYFRAMNSTIEYTARQSDGLRIRNLYGQLVDPWRVLPDRGVRVSDMLIGWNGLGDNPTESYIMTIDYDANRQLVTWRGDDDLTAEGVFQLHHYNKSTSKRFGAGRRGV